jgi:peptidoglycan LD-endopeptidase LytH
VGLALLLFALLLAGCSPEAAIAPPDYLESVARFREGVGTPAVSERYLGEEWTAAARGALENPTTAVLPFIEDLTFDATAPRAMAFEFQAVRGHGITVRGDDAVLLELFHRPGSVTPGQQVSDSVDEGLVAVADRLPGQGALYYEPREHGRYILLVQAKPLDAVEIRLSVTTEALLEWPVEGTDPQDIWSVFGDSRDGGRRVHHGIDIFAPRGTSIFAGSRSTVRRVGVRDRGGNIVTLYDEARGIFLYYAHLDEHRTEGGLTVGPGELIGTVGNTGNALTTPPHLHIGIYDEGWRRPLDPWYFFVPVRRVERLPEVAVADLDGWVRLRRGTPALHAHPDFVGGIVPSPARFDARGNPVDPSYRPPRFLARGERVPAPLAAGDALRVQGTHGPFVRLELPGGRIGYLERSAVEEVSVGIEELSLGRETPVLMHPEESADLRGTLAKDATVSVLAYAGDYGLILYQGYAGWIPLGRTDLLPAG